MPSDSTSESSLAVPASESSAPAAISPSGNGDTGQDNATPLTTLGDQNGDDDSDDDVPGPIPGTIPPPNSPVDGPLNSHQQIFVPTKQIANSLTCKQQAGNAFNNFNNGPGRDGSDGACASGIPAMVSSNGHASHSSVSPQTLPVSGLNRTLVYAIGKLYYDFGTEARRDWFVQQMGGNPSTPYDPTKMAKRLSSKDNQGEGLTSNADSLIWTLMIDGVPVYAILPQAQFAVMEYLALVDLLQMTYPTDPSTYKPIERVAIAGTISGSVRLFNGTVVPTIDPTLRGMYGWKTKDLVDAVVAANKCTSPELAANVETPAFAQGLAEFLTRIYDEMRNPGLTPEDRALNFSATNAFQTGKIFGEMVRGKMVLDTIKVERAPIQRPGSDLWDVKLSFFNPTEVMSQARKTYRITVDVVDEVPVTVGDIRSWFTYFGSQQS